MRRLILIIAMWIVSNRPLFAIWIVPNGFQDLLFSAQNVRKNLKIFMFYRERVGVVFQDRISKLFPFEKTDFENYVKSSLDILLRFQ